MGEPKHCMAMTKEHLTWERMAPRCALVTLIGVIASWQAIGKR